MKIRKLTHENYPKVSALLQKAFPGSKYEIRLFENLHKSEKLLHEWICIHRNKAVAYIAYSKAFYGKEVCGLHLAPLAVTPQMQNQGIGSELLRFSLRQKEIKEKTLFVLGAPGFYTKFGFERCTIPICPFDKNNKHFLSIRNNASTSVTVGYEPEFSFKGN
jgi:putative acetyltransferase